HRLPIFIRMSIWIVASLRRDDRTAEVSGMPQQFLKPFGVDLALLLIPIEQAHITAKHRDADAMLVERFTDMHRKSWRQLPRLRKIYVGNCFPQRQLNVCK